MTRQKKITEEADFFKLTEKPEKKNKNWFPKIVSKRIFRFQTDSKKQLFSVC
jgi:hypothetical protein